MPVVEQARNSRDSDRSIGPPDGVGAGGANCREFGIRSHIRSVLPAALAFGSVGPLDSYLEGAGVVVQSYLRNDKEGRQVVAVLIEQRIQLAVGGNIYPGL